MIEFKAAPTGVYLAALQAAQSFSDRIAGATTPALDMPRRRVSYYLTPDMLSGYGVTDSGELIGVFSSEKGRGKALVTDAIDNGASRLDCFDGYLPEFYAGLGFVETRREANWTPGGPDVVYMALPAQVAVAA